MQLDSTILLDNNPMISHDRRIDYSNYYHSLGHSPQLKGVAVDFLLHHVSDQTAVLMQPLAICFEAEGCSNVGQGHEQK